MLKLQQQKHGAVTLLKPEGALAEGASREFDQTARAVLNSSLGRFVVDMSAVPFVDSGGLETLLDLTELLSNSGKALKLCGTNKTVRQALEIVEIDQLFDYFEDLNSAVRSFL